MQEGECYLQSLPEAPSVGLSLGQQQLHARTCREAEGGLGRLRGGLQIRTTDIGEPFPFCKALPR